MFGLFNPVEGLHTYDVPPVALSETEFPEQMEEFGGVAEIGGGTETTTVSVEEHPLVTVTTYVVVETGFAVGFEMVELLKPVAGLQEYVPPPVACNCTAP